jgi:hypothetical protein
MDKADVALYTTPSETRKTTAKNMAAPRKEARLKPLTLRITARQSDRLTAARGRDDLAIQEHVRRAIDMYLDAYEKRQAKEAADHPASPPVAPVAPAQPRAVKAGAYGFR